MEFRRVLFRSRRFSLRVKQFANFHSRFAVRSVLSGCTGVVDRATATVRTVRPVARAVFAILPAPRRLTNRNTLYAQRSLFAIPRDRGKGVRRWRCDRYQAPPDRDHVGWAASQPVT